jgi:hypothetical protein
MPLFFMARKTDADAGDGSWPHLAGFQPGPTKHQALTLSPCARAHIIPRIPIHGWDSWDSKGILEGKSVSQLKKNGWPVVGSVGTKSFLI